MGMVRGVEVLERFFFSFFGSSSRCIYLAMVFCLWVRVGIFSLVSLIQNRHRLIEKRDGREIRGKTEKVGAHCLYIHIYTKLILRPSLGTRTSIYYICIQ